MLVLRVAMVTHSVWVGEVSGICEPAAEVVIRAPPIVTKKTNKKCIHTQTHV